MNEQKEWLPTGKKLDANGPPGEVTLRLTADGLVHCTLDTNGRSGPAPDYAVLISGCASMLCDPTGREVLRGAIATALTIMREKKGVN